MLWPVAMEVYRGLLCLRKILQKPTDSVPQQDCEYQKLNQDAKINLAMAILTVRFFSEVNWDTKLIFCVCIKLFVL